MFVVKKYLGLQRNFIKFSGVHLSSKWCVCVFFLWGGDDVEVSEWYFLIMTSSKHEFLADTGYVTRTVENESVTVGSYLWDPLKMYTSSSWWRLKPGVSHPNL